MRQTIAIINTANRPWAVVDSSTMFEAWPAARLQELYFSPGGRPFDGSGRGLDAEMLEVQDEKNLMAALANLAPSAIYLRVSPHTRSEYLITPVRKAFPGARLIVEFYDVSAMFDDEALDFIFGGSTERKAAALAGCETAYRHADGLVVKMGGAAFDRWQQGVAAPVISYFPSLSAQAVPRATKREETVRRVLYAGSMSARELNDGVGSVHGANLIRYFDAFAGRTDCRLDIVNAAHGTLAEDASPKFAALLDRYRTENGPYGYRRALPRPQVVALAAGYDVGICCAHYAEDHVMAVTRAGLPNRIMTYIEAGLPVVIDDRFDYGADLVAGFEAGAVVPAGDIDAFMAAVCGLDLDKAREGVARLKQHMLAENAEKLACLQKLVMQQAVI